MKIASFVWSCAVLVEPLASDAHPTEEPEAGIQVRYSYVQRLKLISVDFVSNSQVSRQATSLFRNFQIWACLAYTTRGGEATCSKRRTTTSARSGWSWRSSQSTNAKVSRSLLQSSPCWGLGVRSSPCCLMEATLLCWLSSFMSGKSLFTGSFFSMRVRSTKFFGLQKY